MAFDHGIGFSGLPGDVSTAQTSAGTTQGTAAAMVADYVMVSAVTAGAGIVLPALQPKEVKIIANGDSADSVLVYPATGAAFNGGTANAAATIPARGAAIFMGVTSTVVFAILGAA